MPYLGDLVTYQCTQCGAKHQKVLGSRIVFLLNENNSVKKHGDNIYLQTCHCKNPVHTILGVGYQVNKTVPLWRDMSGNLHDPTTMSNDYVFNVFLMIWNHSVPCHMRAHLPPYNRYTKFPKVYTKNYMRTMFNVMHEKLSNPDKIGLNMMQIGLIKFVEQWLASGECEYMKIKE